MKNIVYKITYLPHINTDLPKYYIGSKYNYKENCYLGSVSSNQIFSFTKNKPLKEWWKYETKNHPERFSIEIIREYDYSIDKYMLVEEEYKIQKTLEVQSNKEYFNQSYATKGWVSAEKTETTKLKLSQKTKEYWNSPEGLEKKKRLVERNKKTKSIEMKKKWEENKEFMVSVFSSKGGRKKGIKNKIPGAGKRRNNLRKVSHKGIVYENAHIAAEIFFKNNINGPTYVRRMCKRKVNDWEYV